jgi:hypothetical protein
MADERSAEQAQGNRTYEPPSLEVLGPVERLTRGAEDFGSLRLSAKPPA